MKILVLAKEIVKKLNESGHTAYFAGGWVRDYLLGHPSQDIDIATDADIETICQIFPHTVPVGAAFGVVIVVHEDHPFEVATFREDLDYHDGRRPSNIKKATAKEDAQRRDFTINGMFYDPIKEEVLDFVNGKKDLEDRVIRTIGDPSIRFQEDRLRLLRAIRFTCGLNFKLDESTKQAIKLLSHTLFPSVAIERVWQEICKMASKPGFTNALLLLEETGLLSTLFPQLKNIDRQELNRRIEPIKNFPQPFPPILALIQLFPDNNYQKSLELADHFKLSKREKEIIQCYYQAKNLVDHPSRTAWTYFLAKPDAEMIIAIYQALKIGSFEKANHFQKELKEHITRVQLKKPLVTSHHLMRQGIKPGIEMGKWLKEAEVITIEKDLKYAEDVIICLRQKGFKGDA
ncbi:MAG: CCA tRNA nucleotidyltransferase [Parachlamydiales bacterium]|nr:CCA tRNA nucleotidyltransferase [Parachlamydiales bacterium]